MTKISIQQLAGMLPADLFGPDEQNRVDFIKMLFDTLTSELETGEEVCLKGLGRFSMSDNADNPVIVEPDASAMEIVNAPFAGFQPEPLAEEVTDDMLSSYDSIAVEEVPVDIAPAIEEVPILVVEEPTENSVESNSVDESYVAETSAIEPGNKSESHDEPLLTDYAESKDSDVGHDISEEPPAIEQSIPGRCLENVKAEELSEPRPMAAPPIYREVADMQESSDYCQPDDTDRKSYSGFWLGFISGLALGAVAFLIYVLFDINSSSYHPEVYDEEDSTELTTIGDLPSSNEETL